MSGITGYHCPWKSRCRAWHAHIALGRHTWLFDVRNGMPLSPLYNIHGGTRLTHGRRRRAWKAIISLEQYLQGPITLGLAYHHRPWTTYPFGRCWALHVIISLGLHTRSDDVGHGNAIISLWHHTRSDVHTRSNDVMHNMLSSSWECTHNWKTSGVDARMDLGRHTRSDDVGRGMLSSPLGSTHGLMTCGMPSWPLSRTQDKTMSVLAMQLSLLECRHNQMTSDVTCYLCHLKAQMIGRLQAWNDPMALLQHKWLDDVGRGMPSSPFDSTYGQKWHTIISIG
uniref:Uncharacterized protein n=1 Tax=Solanum lycopersicum TaxID=4081 RepID=A0A494G8J0_SOLLC